MTASLSDLLLERLQRESKPQDDWPELVLAALEGEAAVDALLASASRGPKPARQRSRSASAGPKRPRWTGILRAEDNGGTRCLFSAFGAGSLSP